MTADRSPLPKAVPRVDALNGACVAWVTPRSRIGLMKLLTPEKDGVLVLDRDVVVQRSMTVGREGEKTWASSPSPCMLLRRRWNRRRRRALVTVAESAVRVAGSAAHLKNPDPSLPLLDDLVALVEGQRSIGPRKPASP